MFGSLEEVMVGDMYLVRGDSWEKYTSSEVKKVWKSIKGVSYFTCPTATCRTSSGDGPSRPPSSERQPLVRALTSLNLRILFKKVYTKYTKYTR